MGKCKIIKAFLFFIAFNVLLSQSLFSSDKIFESAAFEYDSGNFEASLEMYKNIVEMGNQGYKTYNNMGNCYFRLDSISKAVYYYEKALFLNPYSNETAENLSNIYYRISGKDIVANDAYYILIKVFNHRLFNIFITFFVVFLIMAIVMRILIILKKNILYKKIYLIQGCNYLVLILIFVYLALGSVVLNRFNYGVALFDAAVYSEPEQGNVIGTIYEGYKVSIIRDRQRFVFMNYGNEFTGWVEKESILFLP